MMDSLRRITAMAVANTARTFRTPMNVVWMLLVPVIFSLVLSSFFIGADQGATRVYVVNEDRTETAAAFLEGLAATPYELRVVEKEEAIAGMESGDIPMAIRIPAGFEASVAAGQPALELLHGPGYSPGDVEARARIVADALAADRPVSNLQVSLKTPRGETADNTFVKVRMVFGVYLVFAFAGLLVRGAGLHKERQDGTLQRIVSTGVPYGEIVAAHVATIFLVGLLQGAVVIAVTMAVGTHWLSAGWAVLCLTMLGTLFVVSGMAVGVSGIARNATLLQGLSGGLPPLLAMMGGAFFPLDVAPQAMQQLARINPLYWTVELLSAGYVFEGVVGQVVPLAVLVLIGVLGIVVGVQGLRRVEL